MQGKDNQRMVGRFQREYPRTLYEAFFILHARTNQFARLASPSLLLIVNNNVLYTVR